MELLELPHNQHYENQIMCCLLRTDEEAVKILPKIKKDDFYSKINQELFEVIEDSYKRFDFFESNLISSNESLVERMVECLQEQTPGSSVHKYLKHVQELRIQRNVIILGSKCERGLSYGDFTREFEAISENLTDYQKSSDDISDIKKGCSDFWEYLEDIRSGNKNILTGFPLLDRTIGGIGKGDIFVIAGRTGSGKTTFALQVALNMVEKYEKTVGYISLEMPSMQLSMNLMSKKAGVPVNIMRSGDITDKDCREMKAADEGFGHLGIKYAFMRKCTPNLVRSQIKEWIKNFNIDVCFVDHIGLMYADDDRVNANQYHKMTHISNRLKSIALELNFPIIELCQLKRPDDEKRVPGLMDLRDSGSIEQDLDYCAFVHRIPNDERNVIINIPKNRYGQQCSLKYEFFGDAATFKEKPEQPTKEGV